MAALKELYTLYWTLAQKFLLTFLNNELLYEKFWFVVSKCKLFSHSNLYIYFTFCIFILLPFEFLAEYMCRFSNVKGSSYKLVIQRGLDQSGNIFDLLLLILCTMFATKQNALLILLHFPNATKSVRRFVYAP